MRYEFNDKVYVQNKLVWGQVKQLSTVVKGISFEEDITAQYLIDLLGDKLSTALAIVLTEEGKSIKDKDLVVVADEMENTIPVDVMFQVIEDFFICNPVAFLLEKVTGMIGSLSTNLMEKDLIKIETPSLVE